MATRHRRRGVQTTGIYRDVTLETKGRLEAIEEATGERKNYVLEQIIAHVELDESGIPVWWPNNGHAQGELPLTG